MIYSLVDSDTWQYCTNSIEFTEIHYAEQVFSNQ